MTENSDTVDSPTSDSASTDARLDKPAAPKLEEGYRLSRRVARQTFGHMFWAIQNLPRDAKRDLKIVLSFVAKSIGYLDIHVAPFARRQQMAEWKDEVGDALAAHLSGL